MVKGYKNISLQLLNEVSIWLETFCSSFLILFFNLSKLGHSDNSALFKSKYFENFVQLDYEIVNRDIPVYIEMLTWDSICQFFATSWKLNLYYLTFMVSLVVICN